jgi:diguanylate cyclase (GGDEF)-like protein
MASDDRRDALADMLALVSTIEDADEAIQRGLERAGLALGAEFCAIVRDGSVVASRGFPAADVPVVALAGIAAGRGHTLDYGGFFGSECVVVPMEDDSDGKLVLARISGGFSEEERNLLHGMARVLTLAVRMLRRQSLLERLSRIQRSIVHRAALQDVLDGIVAGAGELLGDEIAALRLVEPHNPSQMVMAAAAGVQGELLEALRRGPVGEGVGGRAISSAELVVQEAYSDWAGGFSVYRERGLQAAMAAPVHENGVAVGSLTVASFRPGRHYSRTEQEVLIAFAEHASLALTDARNFEDAVHQAFHDSLTGLPNRALLAEHLELALARARRTASAVALLYVDLDDFKLVNDSLGHAAGDQLLCQIAMRLQDRRRETDLLARQSGDEFLLLLSDVKGDPVASAHTAAEGILQALSRPFTISGTDFHIGASVGVGVFPRDANDAEELLRHADAAMYQAKARGRNTVAIYSGEAHQSRERLSLSTRLRRAIERDELVLHWQPIVDPRDGLLRKAEALVRWDDPSRGLVPPIEFIPFAEDTGLIDDVGEWVLEALCRQRLAWQAQGLDPQVTFNVSPRELRRTVFAEHLRSRLGAHGLDPSRVTVEVTESAAMGDFGVTEPVLRDLADAGFKVAIDDFGAGYSSLSRLRDLPVQMLKIDRSFLRDVPGRTEATAVVTAILELAAALGMETVAEGVESPAQREFLIERGCTYGQGFLLGRPAPARDLEPLLRRAASHVQS